MRAAKRKPKMPSSVSGILTSIQQPLEPEIAGEGILSSPAPVDDLPEKVWDAQSFTVPTIPVSPLDLGDSFFFDEAFYLSRYTDVATAKVPARDHYLLNGRSEGRVGSERELAWAVAVIEASGRFDFIHYQAENGTKEDPIRDFVLNYPSRIDPAPYFDRKFFHSYYPNLVGNSQNAFLAYCLSHDRSWCVPAASALEEYASLIRNHQWFSCSFMQRQVPAERRNLDMALYYCTEGFRMLLDPSECFSTRAYLLESPDIAEAQLNPFVHYIHHGHAEKRFVASRSAVEFQEGLRRMDPDKATILVVSHEASRSGAPIVGLNLARTLAPQYNVISILLRGGELFAEFKKYSVEVIRGGDRLGEIWCVVEAVTAKRSVAAAVLNSIECSKMLSFLLEFEVPCVTLIHEFAQYCWPFTLHARAITLSDAVVYPAEVVREASFLEMIRLGFDPASARNTSICAQGRPVLPSAAAAKVFEGVPVWLRQRIDQPERPFVVMGAGWVQPRKGVDLFIEAARIARNVLGLDCVFVWIGPNFEPEKDMLVSLYLADQVVQSGLADTVFFIEEQASLKPFWAISDAFFVSSRLDPFPNVAIDAIAEAIPVICFERATGIAELHRTLPDRVIAVPYNSAADVARAVQELAGKTPPSQRPARIPASADLEALISFQRYADELGSKIEVVRAAAPARRALAAAVLQNPTFEPRMLFHSMPAWMKVPLAGVSPTTAGLARVAAQASTNGIDIGYLWPGAVTGRPAEGAHDAVRRVFRIVGRPDRGTAAVRYSAIVVVNDPKLLSSVVTSCIDHGSRERDHARRARFAGSRLGPASGRGRHQCHHRSGHHSARQRRCRVRTPSATA